MSTDMEVDGQFYETKSERKRRKMNEEIPYHSMP